MTPVNYPQWKFYLDLLQMLGTVCVFIYVWWTSREKVTAQRFTALEKEVAKRLKPSDLDIAKAARDRLCGEHKAKTDDLTKAYDHLHIEVSRLPDRREITNLDNSIKDLTKELGNLEGRITGLNRVADLMNEFLINQGGKR